MSERTYKVVELVGAASRGAHQAIRKAITRATKTPRNRDWFEVAKDPRLPRERAPSAWAVKIKVGFRLKD